MMPNQSQPLKRPHFVQLVDIDGCFNLTQVGMKKLQSDLRWSANHNDPVAFALPGYDQAKCS